MDINQPTLVQFETVRKQQNLIPPNESNSFYTIGQGRINLFTIRSDPDNYRFDLLTDNGNIYTGAGNFIISGDNSDKEFPYRNMTVISDTKLSINQLLTISKGNIDIHGTIELMAYSQLFIKNKGEMILHSDSTLIINDNTNIIVENGSSLKIYGKIDIHISRINSIMNASNVIIDSAAVLNVSGINSNNRSFTLVDYENELRKRLINIHTQGEKNYNEGRVGYIWRDGSPKEPSYAIGMNLLFGTILLGDFRLPVLGLPEKMVPNLQIISDLLIKKNTTLYITESFHDSIYFRPELYLGIIIGNNKTPANCVVQGKIIADGPNSLITIDRGSTLHINTGGEIHLKNGAIIKSTYNDEQEVLFIDGTLIIDDISQIETFESDNIVFGPKGKVIVLNPDTGKKRLLFTTPNGIQTSDLYRLFKNQIDHIEYHISNNTGIGIDKFFESYSREMTNWFGDRRIEKAIHDGILVWHDGGYIELYSDVTPWINENTTLLSVGRLFKSFGSFDKDILQDAVNRLKYAGCGNILFRFINDGDIKEILLKLESTHMKSIVNNPINQKYVLTTDNNGTLFLRNLISDSSTNNIITPSAKTFEISKENKAEFIL